MHQQFCHIRTVRLVFRLIGYQLHRTDQFTLFIGTGQHGALGAAAFSDAAPECARFSGVNGSIKLTDAPPFTQFSRIPASASRW
jgi:hypothetical protein